MNIVDWVLIGVLVIFAWAGWRQGFIASALSFVGFLGGGLLAAFLLPDIITKYTPIGAVRVGALVIAIVVCAILGQVLTSFLGRRLRSALFWQPARFIDSAAGAALNILALALISWVIVSAVAYLPESSITQSMRTSTVLIGLDRLIPDAARNAFTQLRDSVSTTAIPRVFSGLAEITGPDVPAPDAAAAEARTVVQARGAIVQIIGEAEACQTEVSGSGFVIADGYVLTNAHVVAGIDTPQVKVGDPGETLDSSVVAFDSRLDVAVLQVPGLDVRPLVFASRTPRSGDPAVVGGFPGGGSYTTEPARIRAIVTARGDDIYGKAGVSREVIAFRGKVLPGDSGGPLLSPKGDVYGLVFGSAIADSGTGYAITAAQLAAAVHDGTGRTEAVSTGSCRTR